MAEQKVWMGSIGPFLYDDTDLINDVDGDMPSATHSGIVTTGQMIVNQAPLINGNVLRMQDVTNAAHLTYDEGTFSMTGNGFATPPTVTGRYMKLGKLVSFVVDAFTSTSSANTFNIASLPLLIRPPANISTMMQGVDAGTAKTAVLVIGASGILLLQITPGLNASWTPTGNKGIFAVGVTYILN